MANCFTIEIPCKPYVKAFIESNCGSPANLTLIPDLNNALVSNLKKPLTHRELAPIGNYKEKTTIIIPNDVFYRHGWELSRQSIVVINRLAEYKAKFFMRHFISLNRSLQIPVAVCIREFQERFGYNENLWPYESIKRDYDRNGKHYSSNVFKDLKKEINIILLDNLFVSGTISSQLKNEFNYESR